MGLTRESTSKVRSLNCPTVANAMSNQSARFLVAG